MGKTILQKHITCLGENLSGSDKIIGTILRNIAKNSYKRLPYKVFYKKKYTKRFGFLASFEDELTKKRYVYKYVSLKAMEGILSPGGGIRFSEPTEWQDEYESRFYNAGFEKLNNALPKKIFATCFTTKLENEAAWKAYLYPGDAEKDQLKSVLCFRLKINRSKLISKIINQFKGCVFYEAPVVYLNKYQISNLHKSDCPGVRSLHKAIFGSSKSISNEAYISLLSMKRDYFFYEEELRYFIIPDQKRFEDKYLYLPIRESIEEITVVRPYASISNNGVQNKDIKFELSTNELAQLAKDLGIDEHSKLLKSCNPYTMDDIAEVII